MVLSAIRSVGRVPSASVLLSLVLMFQTGCGGEAPSSSPQTDTASESPPRVLRRAVKAMGTVFSTSILLADRDEETAKEAADAAFAEIVRIEKLMSSYREGSVVSAVNRAAGEGPVAVPPELRTLIEEALDISKRTRGKFDISFGPLGRLWRFKDPHPRVPASDELAEARKRVDYRKIVVDRDAGTVFLTDKGMSIGLGAVAKGYAVDRAADVLRANGFPDFILYGGGDIYISGKKGSGPWRVGVQDPRKRGVYFADFDMWKSGAVVTSGDYERFFVLDGKRFHHILDPATGHPATGMVSATIIAPATASADALATGIFGLGIEQGMALIESDPTLEGILIDNSLAPHISSGLKGRIAVRPIHGAEAAP